MRVIIEIPEYMGDWIEYCKENRITLLGALSPIGNFGEPLAETFDGDVAKCSKWARNNSNVFACAWVNGYEVSREKYYYVAIPIENGWYRRLVVYNSGKVGLDDHNYVSLDKLKQHTRQAEYKLTEKMIKESSLSWAWQFAKELEV